MNVKSSMSAAAEPLGRRARLVVLAAAFSGLVFDGVELGLMPVASLSISQSLLGGDYTPTIGGDWFARFTAALMLGAALGGIVLGSLGDRIGRTRAMGVSILLYSLFAGLGAFVQTQQQMLLLRVLVGLGVGGMWPNGVVLVSECWPSASRPLVAGLMGAGINFGILLLSQITRLWPITPDSWRWIFTLAAVPALLGLFVLALVPESPKWLAARGRHTESHTVLVHRMPLLALLQRPLLSRTIIGIVLASIPLVGAWAASKWMIPWADKVSGGELADYKSVTQGWWALGATLGSFCGRTARRLVGAPPVVLLDQPGSDRVDDRHVPTDGSARTQLSAHRLRAGLCGHSVLRLVAALSAGIVSHARRAAGSGVAMNTGRFATAAGVLVAGVLFAALGGSYPIVGTYGSCIYALGMIAAWWTPQASTLDVEA